MEITWLVQLANCAPSVKVEPRDYIHHASTIVPAKVIGCAIFANSCIVFVSGRIWKLGFQLPLELILAKWK